MFKILSFLAAFTFGVNVMAATDQVEITSAYSYQETVEKLSSAIEGAGMTMFAKIDHAAAAEKVGLQMPPTIVLIFGNPKGGTPLMLAAPPIALDLPLRVLVRQNSDGRTVVGFHQAAELVRAAGLPDGSEQGLAKAEALIRNVIK